MDLKSARFFILRRVTGYATQLSLGSQRYSDTS
jgi:hypothetical protein